MKPLVLEGLLTIHPFTFHSLLKKKHGKNPDFFNEYLEKHGEMAMFNTSEVPQPTAFDCYSTSFPTDETLVILDKATKLRFVDVEGWDGYYTVTFVKPLQSVEEGLELLKMAYSILDAGYAVGVERGVQKRTLEIQHFLNA
ncbi:hypothetical protein [Vibrio sp. Hal054]|uniref:hypothetical protein n=1 Tax=Vibrio sp. Hal054 TaxID=3035158 RepID=UPI00301BD46D